MDRKSVNANSIYIAITQQEMIGMIVWLNEYIESQRPKDDNK